VTYSSHAVAPELMIGIREFNHGKGARAIAFSPFGDAVMTVAGKEARLWEIPNNSRPIVYQHSKEVRGAFFDPSGDWLIISTADGEVIKWDIGSGTQLNSIKFSKPVSAISISMNGDYYAVSSEKNVYIFKSSNRSLIYKWKLPEIVTSLDFAPVGKTLAIGAGKNIYIKEVSKNTSTREVVINNITELKKISFRPYGDMFAGISGNSVIVWDTLTKATLAVLKHQKAVADIAFNDENNELVAASGEQIIFWNILSSKVKKKFDHQGELKSVAISPDGELILSTSVNSVVRLWKIIN
jgi:WD40 repeat protein